MSHKTSKRQRQQDRADVARAMPVVVNLIRGHLDKLRSEFARRLKLQRRKFPKMQLPCETCAFRKSADFTDGDMGFVQTTVSFVHAMDNVDKGAIFYCHERDPSKPEGYRPRLDKPCAAWFVLNSTTPEPLNVRDFLGKEIVDYCADGNRLFNEAQL
jgi:hypothetical protein